MQHLGSILLLLPAGLGSYIGSLKKLLYRKFGEEFLYRKFGEEFLYRKFGEKFLYRKCLNVGKQNNKN